MEENFSRIEDYINNQLSDGERNQFEKELKSNEALLERYNFYSKLKKQKNAELEPINYEKKILPEVNNINFTEKKSEPGIKPGAAAGIILLFIALSSFFFINNQSTKSKIASIELQNDSLEQAYKKVLEQAVAQSSIAIDINDERKETAKELHKKLLEKENEIALLKENRNPNQALTEEISKLKKELSKIKQEYYENVGTYAAEDTDSNKLKSFIQSLNLFYETIDKVKVKWTSDEKYRVKIYRLANNQTIYSSSKAIKNEFTTAFPKNGAYVFAFKVSGQKEFEVLVYIEENRIARIYGLVGKF